MIDELRPLIIENILFVEGFDLPVFRVSAGRVARAKRLYRFGGRVFRGDQVDTPALTPEMVFLRPLQQIKRTYLRLLRAFLRFLRFVAVDDRSGIGRCERIQMALDDHGL